jgi:transposase-like protein
MRWERPMAKKRKRRSFDAHFKAEAVRLCQVGERSVGQVARDLDLTETSLREWVRQAEVDAVNGSPDTLATAEREELGRLRKQVKRLEMEREILKKAAAFFAKESE